jgi:hypothetical protein
MRPGMKKHGTENRKNNETGKHGKNTEGTKLKKVPSNHNKKIKAGLCRSLMNQRVPPSCYFVEQVFWQTLKW